jgi:hypothetical protein
LLHDAQHFQHDQRQVDGARRVVVAQQQPHRGQRGAADEGGVEHQAVHGRILDARQRVRRQHPGRHQQPPAPAGRQAHVAAHAGQHAVMAGDVERVDAAEEHGRRRRRQPDRAQHIAAREEQAGQHPVDQAGLARTGQVDQAHAAGHDDGGQGGGNDECECIHLLSRAATGLATSTNSMSIKLFAIRKSHRILRSLKLTFFNNNAPVP